MKGFVKTILLTAIAGFLAASPAAAVDGPGIPLPTPSSQPAAMPAQPFAAPAANTAAPTRQRKRRPRRQRRHLLRGLFHRGQS